MSSPKINFFVLFSGAIFGLLLEACSDSNAPNASKTPIAIDTLAVAPVIGGGGVHSVVSNMTFTLSIHPATDTLTNRADLFGPQILLKSEDKGRALIATASTAAGFNRFVSFLTDHTDEWIGYSVFIPFVGGSGTSMLESSFFPNRPGSGVDFAGYAITSLEFHVDSISFATPGRDPNKDGVWTDTYLRGRLVVLGHPT